MPNPLVRMAITSRQPKRGGQFARATQSPAKSISLVEHRDEERENANGDGDPCECACVEPGLGVVGHSDVSSLSQSDLDAQSIAESAPIRLLETIRPWPLQTG